MSEVEKKKKLISISLDAKAYSDVYKYATEVIELDIDDGYAWAMKGVAAANIFDAGASKVSEALVFVKKGLDQGIDDDTKVVAAKHLSNAFENGISELNKALRARIVDYQKVSMPKDGSALVHAFGQSVNKVVVTKEMAPSFVSFATLLPLIFALQPIDDVATKVSKYFSNMEAHSKEFCDYLKDDEPTRAFNDAKFGYIKHRKEVLPDFVGTDGAAGKGKEGCFIATAAAGSYHHPKVVSLRFFRDDVLLKTPRGRAFVDGYYRLSPKVADVISRYKILRIVVLWVFITPATMLARMLMANK